MATTPEEIFVKALMEQSPPSPPVLVLDLPQKPNGSSSEGRSHVPNDMVLPYISRVLLEEDDIGDELNDHPALLQVQQPFAQILLPPSSGTNTCYMEGANDLLQDGGRDESTINSVVSSNGNSVVQAFFKGMEEAKMLLPKGKNFQRNQTVSQVVTDSSNRNRVKKRYNSDHHKKMLHDDETYFMGMGNLCVAMDNEAEKKRRCSKAAKDNVVDVHTLLISCAQAVAANNNIGACEMLKQLKKHASAAGDATQRLAQCFAEGLEARLKGSGSQLWQLLMAERPSLGEFCKAFNFYFEDCCINKVALRFSTMTIMQAMVGKSRLHIVGYGMLFEFQWAGLLQLLASREGGLPEVKITAIGHPKPESCPADEQIEEIECRLRKCAHEFGLPSFKFHKIMKKWEDISIEDLNMDAGEVLVVNDLFKFSTLMDESGCFEDPSPRDAVLNNIKKMRPDVFIQSISNSSCGSSFLSRFREALFYYTALFDILDATMPRESKTRLLLEQVLYGRLALNAIACEGLDREDRPEKYRQWQVRNQRAGLRQLPLKSSIVEVVKDMVQKNHHKDFLICEDGQWLLQGWMGRVLFAHSAWVAEDASSRC